MLEGALGVEWHVMWSKSGRHDGDGAGGGGFQRLVTASSAAAAWAMAAAAAACNGGRCSQCICHPSPSAVRSCRGAMRSGFVTCFLLPRHQRDMRGAPCWGKVSPSRLQPPRHLVGFHSVTIVPPGRIWSLATHTALRVAILCPAGERVWQRSPLIPSTAPHPPTHQEAHR